jgi:type IV secretory pathway TrbL component
VEFGLCRRRVRDRDSYLFSRLSAVAILPWFIFVLWYIAPAFYGEWPSLAQEVIYANVITALVGLCVAVFEQGLEQIAYSKPLKAVVLTLFLVSLCLYLIFTFKLPWADVFVEPKF